MVCVDNVAVSVTACHPTLAVTVTTAEVVSAGDILCYFCPARSGVLINQMPKGPSRSASLREGAICRDRSMNEPPDRLHTSEVTMCARRRVAAFFAIDNHDAFGKAMRLEGAVSRALIIADISNGHQAM
jgi:hypothetical protein